MQATKRYQQYPPEKKKKEEEEEKRKPFAPFQLPMRSSKI